MTRPNSTEIIFVVDRSGSMSSIAKAMIEGYGEFINKQRQTPGDCRVTLTQFDDAYEVVYTARPLVEVGWLEIVPRGMTALLDAIGHTIVATGERLAKMRDEDRPSQILFVVITDGHENCSTRYTRDQINQMITHQREKYSWEFVFLGANQDSLATAASIGISVGNAVTFDSNAVGSKALFRGLSANVSRYRVSGVTRDADLYNQSSYDSQITVEDDQNVVRPDDDAN